MLVYRLKNKGGHYGVCLNGTPKWGKNNFVKKIKTSQADSNALNALKSMTFVENHENHHNFSLKGDRCWCSKLLLIFFVKPTIPPPFTKSKLIKYDILISENRYSVIMCCIIQFSLGFIYSFHQH